MLNRLQIHSTAVRRPVQALLPIFLIVLFACAPAQEPSDAEPWVAPVAPTNAVVPTLAPATALPTAALGNAATPLPAATAAAVATMLPTATSIPLSTEGGLMTVDAEQAGLTRKKYQTLLRATWKTDFTRTAIAYDDIMTGGPPKDGIPSIDNPQFESVTDADQWLDDREPVQAVDLNGDPRAYPVQVMVWHELVNDTVGGEPVVITY